MRVSSIQREHCPLPSVAEWVCQRTAVVDPIHSFIGVDEPKDEEERGAAERDCASISHANIQHSERWVTHHF